MNFLKKQRISVGRTIIRLHNMPMYIVCIFSYNK